MKNILFIIIFSLACSRLFGQIGGLSGSKLRSYCVDVVAHHKVEFEPSFYYGQSRKTWNDDKNLEDSFSDPDSINRYSGVFMRITYGLFNRLELGVAIPVDMKTAFFGTKFILLQKENMGLALIGGVNIPMAAGLFNRGVRSEDNTIQAGIGSIFSYRKGGNFSVDFNLEYDHFLKTPLSTKTGTIYTSVDAGYYILKHQLQLIGAIGFEHSYLNTDFQQTRLTIYPGVTIETGKRYIIVLAAPFDIFGRNVNKTAGFSLALTFIF